MTLKEKLLKFAEKGEIKSFMIEFEDGTKVKMSKGRQCKNCGISINHKHINAKFCKTKCKECKECDTSLEKDFCISCDGEEFPFGLSGHEISGA